MVMTAVVNMAILIIVGFIYLSVFIVGLVVVAGCIDGGGDNRVLVVVVAE